MERLKGEVSGANAKKVKKLLKKDKSAMDNSARLLAAKVGVGRTTAIDYQQEIPDAGCGGRKGDTQRRGAAG